MNNNNEIYELKNFKVLGYTTDFQQCECCGRSDLKGTVSILDLNTDVVLHFGSTCAANANKYDTFDAAKRAKKEIRTAIQQYNDDIKFAMSVCRKMKMLEISDKVVADYLKFRSMPENRMKRFHWEQYQSIN